LPTSIKEVERYLFFNHFTEERYILCFHDDNMPHRYPFYFLKDDTQEFIDPLEVTIERGYRLISFKTKLSQQAFVCFLPITPTENLKIENPYLLPPNQSGIFLLDGKNSNILYYADKKICEYFLWNKKSNQIQQVS